MKGTEEFTRTINSFLDEYAAKDNLFNEKYINPEKKLEDCITYILNTVKKSDHNGFTDDEVYGMALHYYDENNVEIGEKIEYLVKVNHHVELTEEEKAEARQKAIEQYQREYTSKAKPTRTTAEPVQQQSLFE